MGVNHSNSKVVQYYVNRKKNIAPPANPAPVVEGPVFPGKKFSIVFPTRERPEILKILLFSLQRNTYKLDDIEVLIAIDNDDPTNYDFLEQYSNFVQVFKVNRSLNFSHDYYNFLASKSKGYWIITANDDCVFESYRWDLTCFNTLKDQNGTIYGRSTDGLEQFQVRGQRDYCCFPLFGRIGYQALGYVFPPRIPTWGADIWAGNLYHQIDRVIRLPIVIKHYCHHNGTRPQDHISRRIAQNQVFYNVRPSQEEIAALMKNADRKISEIIPKEEIQEQAREDTFSTVGFPEQLSVHKGEL